MKYVFAGFVRVVHFVSVNYWRVVSFRSILLLKLLMKGCDE
jgi:hypothetical protein